MCGFQTDTAAAERVVSVGENIHLRSVENADATERYLSWLRDEEVYRYLELGYRTHSIETLREDIHRFRMDPNTIFLAICTNDGHVHIGNIKIERIDWNHRFGELGIMIGDKSCWRRGIGTEAVRLMCENAFRVRGLRRVTAGFFDDNDGSRPIFWRNGFEIEGVLKGHRWSRHAGKWVDEIRVAKAGTE